MSLAAVRAEARAFAAALTLLTRVPLGRRVRVNATDVARSLAWLPLVGTALGGAIALAARGLEGRLDDGPAAVLIVAAWALATGAIHLDGLADSADALGGGDRERRLAIMRDSQIGSFGALALVLVVVLKKDVSATREEILAFLKGKTVSGRRIEGSEAIKTALRVTSVAIVG